MSCVYFTASQDDPSLISCYKRGDKVKLEVGDKNSLPLPATNCTTNSSFLLKHLDHFVQVDSEIIVKSAAPAASPVQAKESEVQAEHQGVQCNVCGVAPVKGTRFKCLECSNYDLCARCQGKGDAAHDTSHTMLYIPKADHVVNEGVWCDGCGSGPIKGLRFKCSNCRNYDLCETCSWNFPADHKKSHVLMFCVRLVEETGNATSSDRAVSSTEKVLRRASEKGLEILDALGQVVLDEVNNDSSQIIVAEVDSIFDSS
jgi:hypothetical protein